MPQYKRKQYSLKQYGKYEEISSQHFYYGNGKMPRARISLKLNNGSFITIYQHRPIKLQEKHEKLRVRTNTGETNYIQSVIIKGNYPVRIKSNLNKQPDSIITDNIFLKKG